MYILNMYNADTYVYIHICTSYMCTMTFLTQNAKSKIAHHIACHALTHDEMEISWQKHR